MPSKRKLRRKHNLEELADLLIARHFRISVQQSEVRDRLAEAQKLAADEIEIVERPLRCIAVVGAGASVPLAERANKLATKLEAEFGRNEEELERLKLVNNLKRKDLETRLIALSRNPDAARKVRQTISDKYDIRHPAVLGYELLAHLLKHRFLDAIISFNFDELLDQSLDDEIGASEYRRVVSERDCTSIQADADAPDYVPLYVKLHGTASEPDSLRFTPDSYYSIPPRVLDVVQDLLHTEQCVIVNGGSSLGSFDLQRLLGLPHQLNLYNLSLTNVPSPMRKKIDEERDRPKNKCKSAQWLHECSTGKHECDKQLQKLTGILHRKTTEAGTPPRDPAPPGRIAGLVYFRPVVRHEVVARLLGSGTVRGASATKPKWSKRAEIEYLRRRTILELAFAGAKARGLLSLVPLARDRPARYYDLYRGKTHGDREDWEALCSAAGLIATESIPDVLVSDEHLREAPTQEPNETHALHKFDCAKLAEHVLARVKNPPEDGDSELLERTLNGLQDEFDVELHTQDDRVCSKAFKRPVTLRTATSLKAYTWLMLHDLKPKDRIHISAETGEWLVDPPISALLEKQEEMRVLVAFSIEEETLGRTYDKVKLKLTRVNPWHHNRHMTIVCKGDLPTRAIYFARHLRTPVITAVYLDSIRDVQHLMTTYEARWDEAKAKEESDKRAEEEAEKAAQDAKEQAADADQ